MALVLAVRLFIMLTNSELHTLFPENVEPGSYEYDRVLEQLDNVQARLVLVSEYAVGGWASTLVAAGGVFALRRSWRTACNVWLGIPYGVAGLLSLAACNYAVLGPLWLPLAPPLGLLTIAVVGVVTECRWLVRESFPVFVVVFVAELSWGLLNWLS